MLLRNGDGTFTGGPLDLLCILYNETTGRFHAAFFEEAPFPGPVPEVIDTKDVRLRSKFVHTEGSDTLQGAQVHLQELAEGIHLVPESVQPEPRNWDGQSGIVICIPNWRLPHLAAKLNSAPL